MTLSPPLRYVKQYTERVSASLRHRRSWFPLSALNEGEDSERGSGWGAVSNKGLGGVRQWGREGETENKSFWEYLGVF